jgi:hypothetical protein
MKKPTPTLADQVRDLELEVKRLRAENKALDKATCVEALDIVNELAKLNAMLDWLLNNRKPGPVCWYRNGKDEEYLMRSREDVDYWMKQA